MTEQLKALNELEKIDERHILRAQITGRIWSKEGLHAAISSITINDAAPEEVRSQFNVARNLALYSHYCYSFAPLVQSHTFTIIEFALKIKEGSGKRKPLFQLLEMAVKEKWVNDAGFRHIPNPSSDNLYCQSLVKTITNLRNDFAHGSNQLSPFIIDYLTICADFVNQLFLPNLPIKCTQ